MVLGDENATTCEVLRPLGRVVIPMSVKVGDGKCQNDVCTRAGQEIAPSTLLDMPEVDDRERRPRTATIMSMSLVSPSAAHCGYAHTSARNDYSSWTREPG